MVVCLVVVDKVCGGGVFGEILVKVFVVMLDWLLSDFVNWVDCVLVVLFNVVNVIMSDFGKSKDSMEKLVGMLEVLEIVKEVLKEYWEKFVSVVKSIVVSKE